jgi:hypothetical protein
MVPDSRKVAGGTMVPVEKLLVVGWFLIVERLLMVE